MYQRAFDVENFGKAYFESVGVYQIPLIKNTGKYADVDFVPFNFSNKIKTGCLHFFIHDYQFERVFREIYKNTKKIMTSNYKVVCTPDCSIYTDYPLAMQN